MLHNCPSSRADLSRYTGLTRAAISLIVDELIQARFLVEGEPILGKVGRKSLALKLNPDLYYIVGVNISRTGFEIGITDFGGALLRSAQGNLEPTPQETLDRIAKHIQGLLADPPPSGDLLGIGITAPGPLDVERGIILNPPNFALWSFINVAEYFSNVFRCPVFLENNSNALALAEKAYGAGQKLDTFVELNVDTGIGSGVIINERLYRGNSGFGNDFGHMSINFNGEPCHCGNIGCAEMYASIPNILKQAAKGSRAFHSWSELVDAAYKGGRDALAILEKEVALLSLIIVNIVNILDVSTVILAGDVAYRSELLLRQLQISVNQKLFARAIKNVDILSTAITEHAAIVSAANVMFDHFISRIDRIS